MISEENVHTGNILDKSEAYRCQFDSDTEELLFHFFFLTDDGKEMQNFKEEIESSFNLESERGAVNIRKLKQAIESNSEYTSVEDINLDSAAFIYELYDDNISITFTATLSEDKFAITIRDKEIGDSGKYKVTEDNKDKIKDIIHYISE